MTKKSIVLLLGLLVIGIFFRSFELGKQSLWIDEGYTINAAQEVVEKGYPGLDSGVLYTNGFLESYVVAGSMSLFGFDPFSPWSARLPSVMFGAGTIISIFFLTRRMFKSDSASVVASAITTFSYWEIAWSRQARGYMMASFFLVLGILFLVRFFQKHKIVESVYSAAFLFVAIMSHSSVMIFVPAFCVSFVIGLVKDRLTTKKLYGVYGFLITIMCLLAYYGIPRATMDIEATGRLLIPIFGPYVFLFLVYIALLTNKGFREQQENIYIALCIGISSGLLVFFSPQSHLRYFLPMFVLIVSFASNSLLVLNSVFRKLVGKYSPYAIGTLFVVLTIGSFSFVPRSNYVLEFGSPQPDFKHAYEYISQNRVEGDVIMSPYVHLNRIYLGDPGVWIPVTLLNDPYEIERKIIHGREFYTGSPIVTDIDEYVKNNSGFILLDSQSEKRIGSLFEAIQKNPNITLKKRFVGLKGEVVTVYRY